MVSLCEPGFDSSLQLLDRDDDILESGSGNVPQHQNSNKRVLIISVDKLATQVMSLDIDLFNLFQDIILPYARCLRELNTLLKVELNIDSQCLSNVHSGSTMPKQMCHAAQYTTSYQYHQGAISPELNSIVSVLGNIALTDHTAAAATNIIAPVPSRRLPENEKRNKGIPQREPILEVHELYINGKTTAFAPVTLRQASQLVRELIKQNDCQNDGDDEYDSDDSDDIDDEDDSNDEI
ncbi:hypothetical protein H4219_006239 [Mycoemilia scoparia]|uniref:Uncharacterized protein n=1 Tax=Mycoemilia scoparia TaxID=417184 RepID=A0A9W8DJA3_9FUNG|nr:hypothetical protein H4219_006239 [Mycoemilia scoparia]